jgi:hypothetical protein
MKDSGHWPNWKAWRWGVDLHSRRSSASEENILDLKYPHSAMEKDIQDQEDMSSEANDGEW